MGVFALVFVLYLYTWVYYNTYESDLLFGVYLYSWVSLILLALCSGCILWLRVLCLLEYDDPYVYKSSIAGCLCYAVCVVSLRLMYKAPKGLISCLDYWVSLATG